MNIAICDDDSKVRGELTDILYSLDKDIICREFDCGEEILDYYRKGKLFDLIFLDIYMEELNGIETAKLIRDMDSHVQIVFLTSSSEFAVESYTVNALLYLLKPLDRDRIVKLWERFVNIYRPRSIFLKDRLFVSADIVSVESMDKKVILRFKDGTYTEFSAKLDDVAAKLGSLNFMRCHRSYIVNMDYVKSVGDCEFIMTTGDRILIRSKQFNQIKREYYGYITSF